ncbi:MAG: class I SAM-dependent methyltransferase [Peptococcaceae bacterium]|nr:class I SAM-dependent methyltransferase [Peptococcaceae bacterium]
MSEIWDKIWQRDQQDWDSLSEEIYQTLRKEMGHVQGKKILEAGSGSGRISLRLALEGAEVTLLDYSPKALEISRNHFNKYKIQAFFINADLTEKLPFEDNSFDVVWNAGVMEHFNRQEQLDITREFKRISREFHTFNPFAGSFFYRLGKWTAEKNGVWGYGKEFPVQSMKDIFDGSGYTLQTEYSIAHSTSLDFLAFVNNHTVQLIHLFLLDLDEVEKTEMLKRMGGYLLYSKGLDNN